MKVPDVGLPLPAIILTALAGISGRLRMYSMLEHPAQHTQLFKEIESTARVIHRSSLINYRYSIGFYI